MTEIIDFDKEIEGIKSSGEKRLYSKKTIAGKQRIEFSIRAHLAGLVSNSVQEKNQAYLCVSPPLNENVDDESVFGFFGHLVNKTITSREDIVFYGLEEKFSEFKRNVEACSVAGYQRYYQIMQDWLFNQIVKLPKFKNTQTVVEEKRECAPRKRGVVFSPQNNGLFCVCVDVKSSIFQGYKDLGVFESSWEEFIAKHTNDGIFIGSKNLRLSVFGRCDIFKKNQTIINNTITPFWNRIVHTIPSACDALIFLSGDECVFGYKNFQQAVTMQKGLEAMQFPPHIVITVFQLEQKTLEKYTYFLRHYTNGKSDIKAAAQEIQKKATEDLRNTKVDYDGIFSDT